MDKIIEEVYEKNNFPSLDKLYKLLKADNISVTKKQVEEYLSKQNYKEYYIKNRDALLSHQSDLYHNKYKKCINILS